MKLYPWEAVEVGADEWFLGRPTSEPPDHGYEPFIDLGVMTREDAEHLAEELNRYVAMKAKEGQIV